MDRDDWPDLENVLGRFVRPNIEVCVVREWHADQITNRVLQLLGKLCRVLIRCKTCGQGSGGSWIGGAVVGAGWPNAGAMAETMANAT
jgi:hypothetical protein